MICDCSCDFDHRNDLEIAAWRVARKRHECCECGEFINKGVRYKEHRILNGGAFNTFRTCDPCARIRKDFCDCWVFGELRETILECLGFDYLEGVG